jgi:WD40 repeat protein
MSVKPGADEDSFALQAMDADGRSMGVFGPGYGGAWSPAARQFAFVAEAGLVVATLERPPDVVVATGESERIFNWPIWSPDGKNLAAVVDSYSEDDDSVTSALIVADADARKSVARYPISNEVVSPFHTSPPNKFRWSPDGTSILISWESAAVFDLSSGRTHRVSWGPIVADWAPAGDAIYYLEAGKVDDLRNRRLESFGRWDRALDSTERLLKRQDLQRLGFAVHPGLVYGHMNLSPSGASLVIVVGSTNAELSVLHVYDAGTLPFDLTAAHPSFESEQPILAVEWAPDERSLATVTLPGDDPLVRILDLDTGEWRTLTTLMLGLEGIDLIETIGLVKSLSWGT